MKIVADTNVLISTILWGEQLQPLSELINEQRVRLCFSPETINEIHRVASYPHITKKAKGENLNITFLIDKIISRSAIVHPKIKPTTITKDPSDNMFLACALEAQASFIISGDKHLLTLKKFQKIPIVTPRQFLTQIKNNTK